MGDGPYKKIILEYVEKYKNIKLFENVEDEELINFYNNCDICVFPTRGGEAFGIVLLEAFACGKPVICSNIDGYNEVANENCALFFKNMDYEDLAQKILLLYNDKNLREKLSENIAILTVVHLNVSYKVRFVFCFQEVEDNCR